MKLRPTRRSVAAATALCGVLVVPIAVSMGSAHAVVAPTYTQLYCYANPDGQPNPVRRVLVPKSYTDKVDNGNATQVEATQTQEVWDQGKNTYVSDSSFSSQEVKRVFGNADVNNLYVACKSFTDGAYPYPPAQNPNDQGGPVFYLSRHGSPTGCSIKVEGIEVGGAPYSHGTHKSSCDGTVWMPPLESGTWLQITVDVLYSHSEKSRSFQVDPVMIPDGLINNDTAICYLVKSDGSVKYTNMSRKGGDCNGD